MYALMHTIKCLTITLACISVVTPQQLCTANSSCTTNTPNAYCTGQKFCTCMKGYVFNCNTIASSLSASSRIYLAAGQTYYFVLDSLSGQQLSYSVSFYDPNNQNIFATYQPEFYTDLGMTTPPQITYYEPLCDQGLHKLLCSFKINLAYQVGTNIGCRLVLRIILSPSAVTPILSFSYSYSQLKQKDESIFLIIGYVIGGLLILTSVIFIVLIYRKKRRPPRRQQQEQPEKCDISHFGYAMPATTISPEHLKEVIACSVCLQQFDPSSNVRATACKHVFHVGCIDEWCMKKLSCPMCRTELTLDSITQLKAQQEKSSGQNSWIINSLHQDQPSQIRNPLFEGGIQNQQL